MRNDTNGQTVIELKVYWKLFKKLLPFLVFPRKYHLKRWDSGFWYFMGYEIAGKDRYLLGHQEELVKIFREWDERPPSAADIETFKRGMADRASEDQR
jgi:hypothetical protein